MCQPGWMSDIEVTKNEAASRYEARLDGQLAGYAQYRRHDDLIVFPHTVTDPAFEGRGVASAIARVSLDEARDAGLRVRPDCSFYAGWIARHPDYQHLLA